MVEGLKLFREHFRNYTSQYVLIGGTACDRVMTAVGLTFRATKDLDIVLCVEALESEFIEAFWKFVRDGKYKTQEKSTGEKQYYRFQKPETEGYPAMLELFSRQPDALDLAEGSHLTPIPADDYMSSLSAILLSDDYYQLIQDGKREIDGLPVVGPEHLIPLKARAWLDLGKRKEQGERIDSVNIKKHKNDVFRLYQLLSPEMPIEITDTVKTDMREFVSKIKKEKIDFKSLGLGSINLSSVLTDFQKIYSL